MGIDKQKITLLRVSYCILLTKKEKTVFTPTHIQRHLKCYVMASDLLSNNF